MIRIPTHRSPTHPGQMLLRDFLQPLEMTQVELAERIKVPVQRVNELIRGKRGMTPDTALRLEAAFGMSAQAWLNAQLVCDLYAQLHSSAASEIKSIQRVRKTA